MKYTNVMVEPAVLRLQSLGLLKSSLIEASYLIHDEETHFDISLSEDKSEIRNAPGILEPGGVLTLSQGHTQWSWLVDDNEHFWPQSKNSPVVISFKEIIDGMHEAHALFDAASKEEKEDMWTADVLFDDVAHNRCLMLREGDSFDDLGGSFLTSYVIAKNSSFSHENCRVALEVNGKETIYELTNGVLKDFNVPSYHFNEQERKELLGAWRMLIEQPQNMERVVSKRNSPRIASLIPSSGDYTLYGVINGNSVSTSLQVNENTWVVELPHVLQVLERAPKVIIHQRMVTGKGMSVIEGGWDFKKNKPLKFVDLKNVTLAGPTTGWNKTFKTWNRIEPDLSEPVKRKKLESAFFAKN